MCSRSQVNMCVHRKLSRNGYKTRIAPAHPGEQLLPTIPNRIGTRNTRYWFIQSQRLSRDSHNSGRNCEYECEGFHSLHIVSIDNSLLIRVSAFSFQLFRFMLVFVLWMKSTHVRFAAFRKIFLALGKWITWLCVFSLPVPVTCIYILLFFDLLNRRHLKRKINPSSHFDSLRLPSSKRKRMRNDPRKKYQKFTLSCSSIEH